MQIILVYASLSQPVQIHNFFNNKEIDTLMNIELPRKWYPSVVVDPSGKTIIDPDRTSSQYKLESPSLISQLTKKIQKHKNMTIEFEEGSFIKYEHGQFFGLHGDAANIKVANHFAKRSYTLLLCLQPATKGGETNFPFLKKQFSPQSGDAIIWYNYNQDNREDEYLDHESIPVLTGTKLMINAWFS